MKETKNFLDKNTLVACCLVFISWFAWDAYMRKKYPELKKVTPVSKEQKALKPSQSLKAKEAISLPRVESLASDQVIKKEKLFAFKSSELSFQLSSQGMGLKQIVLPNILDQKGQKIWLFKNKKENLPFETRFIGQGRVPLYFNIKKISPHSWEGQANWQGVKIKKLLSVSPSYNFLLKTSITVEGNLSLISGITTFLNQNQEKEEKKGGLLSFFIQPDIFTFFVSSSKGHEQMPISSISKEDLSQSSYPKVRVAALGTKYFGQAWMEDQSDVLPEFQVQPKSQGYQGAVHHYILNPEKAFEVSYKMFIGPKDFTLFQKEHTPLLYWVDFGWFGSLSRFTLQILASFYALAGNWGLSIILLTFLVRLLLLPCMLYSHRSMEVMRRVQPEIQKIREKFKKDPQRMNQEVIALMKNNKANPLGGFLPLLLQIPVFWALWRALSNSYSLYQTPFYFWIEDLSTKDPYYVLPISMGALMFVHQKISSVSMSKDMARIMQIMPILMTLFMINLPSGLMLYMLVSTAFGLIQQVFLNKQTSSQPLPSLPKKDKKNV